jgi:hypothetical protein
MSVGVIDDYKLRVLRASHTLTNLTTKTGGEKEKWAMTVTQGSKKNTLFRVLLPQLQSKVVKRSVFAIFWAFWYLHRRFICLQDIALGRGARKAMTRVVLVLLLCGSAAAIIGKEYVSLHSK